MMHPTAGGPPPLPGAKAADQPPKGTSRFTVLYHKTSGTKKEKQWREGSLSVGFDAAVLYSTETNTCVTVLKGSGLLPNRVYQAMEKARRGAAWVTGAEVTVGVYTCVVEEVRELHLIPYDEAVVWGDGSSSSSGDGSEKKKKAPEHAQPQPQDTARPRRQLLHAAAPPPPAPLPPVFYQHAPPAPLPPPPRMAEEPYSQAATTQETSYSWAAVCVAAPQQKLPPSPPTTSLPPPKRKRSRSEVMTELQNCFPWL